MTLTFSAWQQRAFDHFKQDQAISHVLSDRFILKLAQTLHLDYRYTQIKETLVYQFVQSKNLLLKEVKDFVDLYFLLPQYNLWQLLDGVKKKFHREIDILLLADDLAKSQRFEYLPVMLKPLTLPQLKTFFDKQITSLVEERLDGK